jgi:nitroreductase
VDYPWLDLGIAGEHLVLAATEMGLGTCWIGWIKPRAVARIVGWPRSIKPAAVITVGYPTEPVRDPGTERKRKAVEEIVKWM